MLLSWNGLSLATNERLGSFINTFIHWLLIPVKVALITVLATYHRLSLSYRYPYNYDTTPIVDIPSITSEMASLSAHVEVTPEGLIHTNTNNDHQALRHGSLLWASPTQERLNALEHLFVEGAIVRGIGVTSPVPPAMPMAVAFGIVSAMRAGLVVSPSLSGKFRVFVGEEASGDFSQEADTNIKPRAKSTAFDAIYALSLLHTADMLFPMEAYGDRINDILFSRGYAALLLAPLTYTTESNRGYFRDHIAIMGLSTCYHACKSAKLKRLYGHALSFIAAQSYVYCNPYFAALARECGVLPEKQRLKVLSLHEGVSLTEASMCSSLIEDGKIPSSYATHSSSEFTLDELGPGGVRYGVVNMVPLSGLCLGRSIQVLWQQQTDASSS